MAASESPEAARAALEILDAEGNAVDAAVATTFAIGHGLGPARAIDAERLDAQLPPEVIVEDGRVSALAGAELISRGHVVASEGEYSDVPLVQADGIDPETGERLAVTDPRSGPRYPRGRASRRRACRRPVASPSTPARSSR